MQAQRRTQVETDVRPQRREVDLETLQVSSDMRSGRKEIRQHEYLRGSAMNASGGSVGNRGRSEFQICDLNEVVGKPLLHEFGELAEVVVGGGQPAAVSNQQNSALRQ